MPGPETVPPDPEDVRTDHAKQDRRGEGVPGEDHEYGPLGEQGEKDDSLAEMTEERVGTLPGRRMKRGDERAIVEDEERG